MRYYEYNQYRLSDDELPIHASIPASLEIPVSGSENASPASTHLDSDDAADMGTKDEESSTRGDRDVSVAIDMSSGEINWLQIYFPASSILAAGNGRIQVDDE